VDLIKKNKLIVLLFLLFNISIAQDITFVLRDKVISNIYKKTAIVRIQVDKNSAKESIGNFLKINNNIFLFTVLHGIPKNKHNNLEIIFYQNNNNFKISKKNLIYSSEGLDFAIFELTKELEDFVTTNNYYFNESDIEEDRILGADICFVKAFTYKNKDKNIYSKQFIKSYISEVNRHDFYIDKKSKFGSSGSFVVDLDTGKIHGYITQYKEYNSNLNVSDDGYMYGIYLTNIVKDISILLKEK
jgi:hypothetical protein